MTSRNTGARSPQNHAPKHIEHQIGRLRIDHPLAPYYRLVDDFALGVFHPFHHKRGIVNAAGREDGIGGGHLKGCDAVGSERQGQIRVELAGDAHALRIVHHYFWPDLIDEFCRDHVDRSHQRPLENDRTPMPPGKVLGFPFIADFGDE